MAVCRLSTLANYLSVSLSLSIDVSLYLSLAKSQSHGWRVEPKYTEAVTHVVCGAAAHTNKANIRSAKFLRAVASGKWVVNGSWLQECKLRGAQAKEDAFEVSGDKKSVVPAAPRRSRLAHAEPVSLCFRHFLFGGGGGGG